MQPTLTNSEYIIASNCEKYYWQRVNKPHRASNTHAKSIDATLKKIRFLGTSLVSSGRDAIEFKDPVAATEEFLQQKNGVLYNARFRSPDGVYTAHCDVVLKSGSTISIYIVKPETKIKEPNDVYELGFIYYVLKSLGYKPGNIKLTILYLNKYYRRKGPLSVTKLFNCEDVTYRGKNNYYQVESNLRQWALRAQNETVPTTECTQFCFHHNCPFINACWGDFDGINMFNVNNYGKAKDKVIPLYKKDFIELADVPHKCGQIKKAAKIEEIKGFNKTKIGEYLKQNGLTDSFYSLSLVPYKSPIPLYNNSGPFFQMEYQFSLIHRINGEETHFNFLIDKDFKFRSSLIRNLLRVTETPGNIVVANHYEVCQFFDELTTILPGFEKGISGLKSRLVNLMLPFEKNYYPHPSFKIYKKKQIRKTVYDEDGNQVINKDEKQPPSAVSFKSVIPIFIKDWEYDISTWDIKDIKAVEDKVALFPSMSDNEYEKCKRSIIRYHDLMATLQARIIEKFQQLNK